MDDVRRRIVLGLVILAILGMILSLEQPWRSGSTVPPAPDDVPSEYASLPGAADFRGATAWLNTPQGAAVELTDLRGKVVLVDFWTYSCVNCIRTFPWIRAWHEKYEDYGLVVVGVHSPEFRFERDIENVRDATDRYGLTHATALDNDFDIWKAYHNRYWPAKYLIGPWGKIHYTHFGEGAYQETEREIQKLLKVAGYSPPEGYVDIEGYDPSRPTGRSPELFAAAAQGEARVAIGNPEGYQRGQNVTYARPETIPRDKIYLAGTWYNDDDHLRAVEGDLAVMVRFKAGGSNFVADGPDGVCVVITLDDQPFSEDRSGQDIVREDDRTCIYLDDPRSYDYYAGPFEEHLLELRVPAGFQLYSFAFSDEATK